MIITNSNDLINQVIADVKVRVAATRGSHLLFQHIYLSRYITHETADFQKEMLSVTENDKIKFVVIVAFRGSAKSTIMTLSYPIWAIIGKLQKKFIVIISQTQQQAKLHLSNLKYELLDNQMLKDELGPFKENDEWGAGSIVIPKFNARIMAASCEQSIRGLRHMQYRPDLIICDDIEDISSVKTKEARDKTYNWLTGDIIPAGDENTKIIIIGNLLHEDSLLMKLRENIEHGKLNGSYYSYPLIDENDQIIWPGKYPTLSHIDQLKLSIGNDIAWNREYLLKIIPDEGQVIHPDWIRHYDVIKEKDENLRFVITGVDPAISLKEAADYTAMVTVKVYGRRENLKIYILPNPINKKLNFPDTVKTLKQISGLNKCRILIENVAYQKSLAEQLRHENISAEDVSVNGQDKRARLTMISHLFMNNILFPNHGAEELISQILGFGIEKHDDLVDALTIAVMKIIEEDKKFVMPEIFIVNY